MQKMKKFELVATKVDWHKISSTKKIKTITL